MDKVTLIIGDSLRYDYVSFHGQCEQLTTPNIDSIAEKSVVFLNCESLGHETTSSTTYLLMGDEQVKVTNSYSIPPESFYLSQIKQSVLLSSMPGVSRWAGAFSLSWVWNMRRPVEKIAEDYYRILKNNPNLDFVYIHSFLPHNPYRFTNQQPLKQLEQLNILKGCSIMDMETFNKILPSIIQMYIDGVKEFDKLVGLIHEIDKKRHLIISADHGECLGEGDKYGHGSPHGILFHIPLIIWSPDNLVGGVIRDKVNNTQTIRTVVELLYGKEIENSLCSYFPPQPDDSQIIAKLKNLGYIE